MNEHSSAIRPHSTVDARPAGSRGKAAPEAGAPFASHVEGEHVPPAQAARAALEGRPDLAGRPFGAIVSLLARHQELPAADGPAPTPPAEEVAGEEPTPTPPAESAESEVAGSANEMRAG
jgi:hypothetical protein